MKDLTDDGSLPPSSDTNTEFVDVIDSDNGEIQGWPTLKRKASDELCDGAKSRWKVARREEAGTLSDDRSEVETNDRTKLSRSAAASRRLIESMRSGEFVVNERKKKRFEEKCNKMDRGAKFHYDNGWYVLHSKCSKWLKMPEQYKTTRFKSHIGPCEEKLRKKRKKRNTSITNFFKPRDPNETEAKAKIEAIPGQKQIFTGGSALISSTPIKPPHSNYQLVPRTQPCTGISDIQDPRVSTYISRTVVEGAGSISPQKATEWVYGDAKYSELTDDQKKTVAVAQYHLRSWTINRQFQVVFSTTCMKSVEQDQWSPKTICRNCEEVVKSDAFGRALRVGPTSLEAMKFIPIKFRGPLVDLGTKFAHVRGLSELLLEVRSVVSSLTITPVMPNTQQDPQTSIWVRFARGVVRGEYKDNLVFLGMIEATVMAHNRKSRGVGLQNMQYQPIYEEFAHMVALTSPRTYKLFASHIQLPSLRHYQ